jgi:hypothetical protein
MRYTIAAGCRRQVRVMKTLRISSLGHTGSPHALVAQLDRASDFESEGREFESLRARHRKSKFAADLRATGGTASCAGPLAPLKGACCALTPLLCRGYADCRAAAAASLWT